MAKDDRAEVVIPSRKDGKPPTTTTKHEYDLQQLGDMFQTFCIGAIVVGMLHVHTNERRLMFFHGIYYPFLTVECPLFR